MVGVTSKRIITVEQAELRTASVEIQHVTVNARKMTLSVFRQIPHESLIVDTDDGGFALGGVPWGLVNYYWGGDSDRHLHVLWQRGKELRRALVSGIPYIDVDATEKMNVGLCQVIARDPAKVEQMWTNRRHDRIAMQILLYSVMAEQVDVVPMVAEIDRHTACDTRKRWVHEYPYEIKPISGLKERPENVKWDDYEKVHIIDMHNKKLIEESLEIACVLRKAEVTRWNRETGEKENKRREAFNALVWSLKDLPQLFIAV